MGFLVFSTIGIISQMSSSLIKIPLEKSKGGDYVVLFLDEFPDYLVEDILTVLQLELAPLHVWRECAVEYHRQDKDVNFQLVLSTITSALQVPSKHINKYICLYSC